MPRIVYSEINLHIAWHTKNNAPILVDDVERPTHSFHRQRAIRTDGVTVHAVNGMADHVLPAVSVPPTLPIAEWVGEFDGACAYFINHEICHRKVPARQTGYGVVSFGTKDLPWVIRYCGKGRKSTTQRN